MLRCRAKVPRLMDGLDMVLDLIQGFSLVTRIYEICMLVNTSHVLPSCSFVCFDTHQGFSRASGRYY